MTTGDKTGAKHISPAVNRWFYAALVLFAVYYLFVQKDVLTAASNLGIAFIFDPFNANITWANRKTWQKSWLIVHVAVVIALLLYEFIFNRS